MKAIWKDVRSHWREIWHLGLIRVVPSLVLIVLFVIMMHVYNQWVGLEQVHMGQRTVAAFGLGVLIFGPAGLQRRRAQFAYLGIASIFVSALFIVHFLYTSYAGGFLSISALEYAKQLGVLGGSVHALVGPQLLFFATLPPAVIVLLLLRPRHADQRKVPRRARVIMMLSLIFMPLLSAGWVFAIEASHENGHIDLIVNQPYNSDELVRKVGILNYSVYDIIKFASHKKDLTASQQAYVTQNAKRFEFKPEGTAYNGALKGKNVIFVQLESIQQFLINQDVNGQPVMPNLREISGQSTSFNDFHYTVGPGTSSDAEFTTFNSLMYLGDGAVFFQYPNNEYEALPETLDKAGYTTVAMHGDSKNFWNRSAMYPSLGFQTFHGVEAYTEKEKGLSWGVSDRDFLLQSAAKLPELKQPYYAHMITLSSHTPYIIPEKYRQLDVANLRISDMQKNYLQAAHYTDSALGEFVADLKTRGLWDNTVLVLMGDHEAFMTKQDDADFASFLGYKGGFNDLSYLQARQIPFIIHAPGLPAQQLSIPGSQLDVYPTLTNLLGLKTPPTVLGKDLLNTTDPLVTRRRRTAGIDLEMVLSSQLNYVGSKNSSSFSDGKCYRGQIATTLELCRPIYDRAHDKVQLSDLIVTGNALNLLK